MIPEATAADDPPAPNSPDTDNSLKEYKAFIDGLVRPSRFAQWARQGRWPDNETDLPAEQVSELLSGLTPERRELLARMLERAEDSGTLAVLYLLDVRSYRLSRECVELPRPFPYGLTSLWGSWSYRKRGDACPSASPQASRFGCARTSWPRRVASVLRFGAVLDDGELQKRAEQASMLTVCLREQIV